MVDYRDLDVAELMLDGQNPRHPSAVGQREAIAALLAQESAKMIELAKDVADAGLSPIDMLLVVESATAFTVVEGNRRVAVLKLLLNPDLAPTTQLQKRFRDIGRSAKLPSHIRCAVVGSKEEGRHWIELRHTGERGGAGVVPWNSEATQRFAGRRGSQADKALALIDAVTKAFAANEELKRNLDVVRQNRLTTFGRLVSDPVVREALGIRLEGAAVLIHYAPASVERGIERIAADLAKGLTVSELKTKLQRRRYIGRIKSDLPDPSSYQADPVPMPSGGLSRRSRRPTPQKPSHGQPPERLFDGVVLANMGGRVAAILSELQRLDLDKYPNASAVLIRVVLELAIEQVYEQKKWKPPADLKAGVKLCLTKIDPTQRDRRFQPVRAGLQDGTSLLAVRTIHAFLHNPHFRPSPTDLRSIASNYTPFLTALDSLI